MKKRIADLRQQGNFALANKTESSIGIDNKYAIQIVKDRSVKLLCQKLARVINEFCQEELEIDVNVRGIRLQKELANLLVTKDLDI